MHPIESEAILETSRLLLEPLSISHAPALYEPLQLEAIYEFIPENPPTSLEVLIKRYQQLSSRKSPDEQEIWLNWAMRERKAESYVGILQATVSRDATAHLAYILFPLAGFYRYLRVLLSRSEGVNLAGRGLVIHQVRLNFTDDAHIPWFMKAILVLAQIFLRHLIDVLIGPCFRNFYDMASHREPMPGIAGVHNVQTDFWPLFHVQRFLSPFQRIDQEVGAIKVNPDRVDLWSVIWHERGQMSKSGFFKQLESCIGNSYGHVVSLLTDLDGKPIFPYLYLYHIHFEQINAFHSRCDHRYPSCTRGHRTRSNGKVPLLAS